MLFHIRTTCYKMWKIYLFIMVLKIKSSALHMLGKCCTTELCPQSKYLFFNVNGWLFFSVIFREVLTSEVDIVGNHDLQNPWYSSWVDNDSIEMCDWFLFFCSVSF